MKMEASNDVVSTPILNSEAAFRAELAQIQQEAGQNQEVSNEPEQESAEVSEELASEDDNAGDSPDSTNHDDIGDNADDSFDPRAPIPPSRLKKETLKRKALEEQVNKEREERIRAQTELDMISKALRELNNPQSAPQQPKSDGFDPLDEDAHRYYKEHYAQKDKVDAVEARLDQIQFVNALTMQEAAFERSNPDFKDAYQHLCRTEIAANQYITNDPSQAEWMANSKLQGIAKMALDQGKNVAEIFYNMSKSYGYTPKSKSKKPESNLDAIESNMRKSKVADVPVASVTPGGSGSYTTLKNFEKHLYDGSPAKREENAKAFHDALRRIKDGK